MARPTVVTEDVIRRLEDAFKIGANDKEAYVFANISHETYYNHMESDETFRERMEAAKQFPLLAMKKVVVQEALRGDKQSAMWWLERKAKAEFAPRTELTGSEGMPLGYINSGDLKELSPSPDKPLLTSSENTP